ncbi:MAG TPA: VOC family protein [Dermatophilaceae bacterium]
MRRGNEFRVLRGDKINVFLYVASTPITARDQKHLDLYSDDQTAQVERLVALGALVIRHAVDSDNDHVVMTDPESNEFCVCARSIPTPSPLNWTGQLVSVQPCPTAPQRSCGIYVGHPATMSNRTNNRL